MMIDIGIALPGKSVGEVVGSAEAAARFRFDSFSVYSDLFDLPPYAVLHHCRVFLLATSRTEI
jgi:hypothetical protein